MFEYREMNVEYAEHQVSSVLSRKVLFGCTSVPQEIIAHGRFCVVSRKEQPPSSDVVRADNDRQVSVVEPDLQTVRAHMIACAST